VSYDAAEASVQDSSPVELVEIVRSDGVTHRHTSGSRDVEYGGQIYTAIPISRTSISVSMPGESDEDVSLTMPIDHPLVKRWTQQMTPPQRVSVSILRQNGGETRQIWAGDITSMACDRNVAKFRIPSRPGEWMMRAVSSVTVGRQCPHQLYDKMCRVSRTGSHGGLAHKVTATAIAVSGRNVTVDLGSTSRNNGWAESGEVRYPGTGESMTVGKQVDQNPGVSAVAVLTMQAPIIGLKTGDTIEVFAGCDWSIVTCDARFGNRQNYGGAWQKPDKNPFIPGRGGIKGSA
jgi:uncharacterized phage protein (TIGR02218 family)